MCAKLLVCTPPSDDIEKVLEPNSKYNWYVFYTHPRAEKIALREIQVRGYNAFLPTYRTYRVWKNRKKVWVEHVLFPSYVFVNTTESNIFDIKRIPKIVTVVHTAGIPSIIPESEINALQNFLNSDHEVTVETSFNKGDNVRITQGPLAGHEGILQEKKGKTRFGIYLKEINHAVFIDICANMLDKIECF